MMLKQCAMVICGVMAVAGPVAAAPAEVQQNSAPVSKPEGSVMRLAGLPEASGLVASRTAAGRLWAHNDSGKPEVFSLDTKGQVTGRVLLSGAALEDWEAMATGPCGGGTCLYLADIGDNEARCRAPRRCGKLWEMNPV